MALDLDWQSVATFASIGIFAPAVLAVGAVRRPSDRRISRWGAMAGLDLSERSRATVRAHLGRVRRSRSLAALPLWWLGPWAVVDGAGEVVPRAVQTMSIALAVYLVAGMIAEVTTRPAPMSSGVGASLTTRSESDFVPSWIRALGWGTWAVAAAALASGRVEPWSTSAREIDGNPGVVIGAGLVVLVVSEFTLRRVAARAQRGFDVEGLAVDDALRATACAGAAASGALAGFMSMSAALSVFPQEGPGLLIALLAGFALSCMSFAALTTIVRQETLGYRRRHRPVEPGSLLAGSPRTARPNAELFPNGPPLPGAPSDDPAPARSPGAGASPPGPGWPELGPTT